MGGINHHVVVRGICLGRSDIVLDAALPVGVLKVVVAVSANIPGNESVTLLDELDEFLVLIAGNAVVSTGPPVGRAAQHDGPTLGYELVNERFQVYRLRVAVIVESDAPEGQERLSVLVEVVLLLGTVLQLVLVHEALGIGHHGSGHGGIFRHHAAHVVHDGDGPSVLVGALHGMGKHLVKVVLVLGILDLSHKALHEHAVQAVVLHPLEVREHGGLVVGAEHCSMGAVRHDEGRAVAGGVSVTYHILLLIFAHVGPEIYGIPEHTGTKLLAFTVVVPSLVGNGRHGRTVAGGSKPTLIPCHNKATVGVIGVSVIMGGNSGIGIFRSGGFLVFRFLDGAGDYLLLFTGEGNHGYHS